jgi:hypothetical protein
VFSRIKAGSPYEWSVAGAQIMVSDSPVLTILTLPPAGTEVTVDVSVTNALNIRAKGEFIFTTAQAATGSSEHYRQLDCSLRNLRTINLYIPPWVPNEAGNVQLRPEQLASIRDQAQQIALAAKRVIAAVKVVNIVEEHADKQRAARA